MGVSIPNKLSKLPGWSQSREHEWVIGFFFSGIEFPGL